MRPTISDMIEFAMIESIKREQVSSRSLSDLSSNNSLILMEINSMVQSTQGKSDKFPNKNKETEVNIENI